MAVTRRFGTPGIGDEVLSVRFDARVLIRLATRTGQSYGPGFREALAGVHERVAIKIQEAMVQSLKTKVNETGRQQRGTNHLELALLDERNREVTASNFTVLRPSWMDRSPAELYWRRIEEGDSQTYSGYILFTNNFSKWYGPWSPGGTRSAGTQTNYSRPQPAGYKHMRMPFMSARGAYVQNIGPWPRYNYTSGGARVMRNTSMKAEYSRALSRVGIKMADVTRAK